MTYVALLRGINVGGRKPVKMADLTAAFEQMGFEAVRTVLASGNVVFEVPDSGSEVADPGSEVADPNSKAVADRIEAGLKQRFGHPIGVVVRRLGALEELVVSNPFAAVAVTPETRLYVTFLSDEGHSGTGIHAKTIAEDGPGEGSKTLDPHVQVVGIAGGQLLTAIRLSPEWGTTDLMAWLDREFGRGVTTRNWNTIERIVGAGRG